MLRPKYILPLLIPFLSALPVNQNDQAQKEET